MRSLVDSLARVAASILGACLGAGIAGLVESGSVLAALSERSGPAPSRAAVALTSAGLLTPVALAVGLAVGLAALVLDPDGPTGPGRLAALLRRGTVLDRLRAATLAPVTVLVLFGWCVASAHVARATLASGSASGAGLTTAMGSLAALALLIVVGLAVTPRLRRTLAVASGKVPALLDPVLTGGVALALVAFAFVFGIASGDTGGGAGEWVGGGVLGVFGVLKRSELDLRPVGALAWIAGLSLALPMFAPRRAVAFGGAFAGALGLVLACAQASSALGTDDDLRRGLEADAPLTKVSLSVLRKATDRDRDGFSAKFGGGDCDDANREINPAAVDEPGNGVDEDCSGADTPAPPPRSEEPASTEAARAKDAPARSYNVVLLTIDTLRADNLGFAGRSGGVTPNLDALAGKSTVFEQAYSMASYTGKAVGPMLIGKYPSETNRSFSHFDTYYASNVMLAERLQAEGIRTFAGMCHWYFKNPTGLSQGFDVWDTSALPPGMGDNDTSVSSDRLSKVALELLSDPANVTPPSGKRFFAWFHYFDPHAQYVAHEGSPDFTPEKRTGMATARALYDQEVWFTDKHIGRVLDHIAAQPWAADTAIVVTADHGEAFGEHAMAWHGREIWEPLVRVPLVVYVPGADGKRVAVKRSHIDLAPTILELAGVAQPTGEDALQGTSLLDDVFAAEGTPPVERDVFIDMPAGPFNDLRRAIVTGPSPGMKLLHFGGANVQLFDLAADPEEKTDLSKDKERLAPVSERLAQMRARLKEVRVKEK